MTKSDIIIIGSGPGGYRAAEYAAHKGLSVTIIEAEQAGGTCLNRGCIPTKTLCRNAEIIDTLRQADTFGMTASFDIDFGRIKERKNMVVDQLRSGVVSLMSQPGITFVQGFARMADSHSVAVGDDVYAADNIIIATGSSPKMPPFSGTDLPGVVDSNGMLDIDHIPQRLCIIGAGVIGMEFASVFSSFGSQVTVVEYLKECLPTLDSDIAKRLRQSIGKRGVDFYMQSAVSEIKESVSADANRTLTVCYDRKGKPMQIEADTVLIATGRRPNIDGLDLEKAGVEYTPKGITTDNDFHTTASNVFAIGDVNGRCMLAHAATFQGIHVVNSILGIQDNIRFDVMPSAIFTYPEAASVGLSEDLLKTDGRNYECRKGFYRANGKALAMNETDGMLKLLVDTDDDRRIVGCHAFGSHSADIVQEVTALINRHATLADLADIIHIHPTLGEILHDMSL